MVHSDLHQTDNINMGVPENNVGIIWVKEELNGEKTGTLGNGVAGNNEIVVNPYSGERDNLVIYNYEGNRLWSSGDKLNLIAGSQTPLVDIHGRVIICDNRKIMMIGKNDKDKYDILWKTEIPYFEGPGPLFPWSPTIVKGKTIILPTKGPVYAFNAETGELLAEKYLGEDKNNGENYFLTINSTCVNEDKVYLSTVSTKKTNPPTGRLYALKVDPKSEEIITEEWYYPFRGISQATPTFIDKTLYFDGQQGLLKIFRKPHIYAVIDKGIDCEEKWIVSDKKRDCYLKWKVRYPKFFSFPKVKRGMTMFSFSKDPRHGFWYEDWRGRRLVRFSEENGDIVEEILITDLIKKKDITPQYLPMSCMTICYKEKPVMLISAIIFLYCKYVMAVDLTQENEINRKNSFLWDVRIESEFGLNYAPGQFTIIKKDENSANNRIVFSTNWGGVIAIGSADET
ncbi:MAG: hypothetical protein MUO82_10435 [Candidatus Thermoplasmatota archaeon]|nr:hypothetical protein [Candidatus Thermoplasmatota archaeon]